MAAEKILNGPEPFIHPVNGVLVDPFQWYEGFAHTELEKEVFPQIDLAEDQEDNLNPDGGAPDGDDNPKGSEGGDGNPEAKIQEEDGAEGGESDGQENGEVDLFSENDGSDSEGEEAPKKSNKRKKKDEETGE